jgi:hypothetical protein
MTGGAVFGLVWAAVGLLLGIRWWSERARWQATSPSVAPAPDARARFGGMIEDGSARRTAAMLLAYAAGATVVGVGLLVSTPALLGIGALLVNVGTIFRFLVLALDRAHLESPLLPPRQRQARHLSGPVVAGSA